MLFSKGPRQKKSARQVRVRYRPELLGLEDRVLPSAAGLNAIVPPAGHGPTLIAAAAANAATPPSDPNIGDQVSDKAQELRDARTPGDPQGIGSALSAFVHTLVPAKGDEGNSGGGDDTDPSSGNKGIGDQVSAKAHELQDARTSGDSKGIGAALSAFVHTLVPVKGDEENSDAASDDDTENSSGDKGMIGDQVSAKAQELRDARTPGDSQGIGSALSAFVHTLVPPNGDEGNSDSSSAPAAQSVPTGVPNLPTAAGDGITTASNHNASSQAAHSPIFDSGSSADSFATWPAAAPDGLINAFSEGAEHSSLFESELSEDTCATLPAAADDGIRTAAGENASSQAPEHSPVFDSDCLTAADSSADSEGTT